MHERGARDAVASVAVLVAALVLLPGVGHTSRLKEVLGFKGVRDNQIIGYGLVVGLAGTGDKTSTEFTKQSLTSMLRNMGISVGAEEIKVKNVAAVMVTGRLPAFARTGGKFDVTVSSLGDARSLEGGTLVMTPLRGTDGLTYAIAQGAVSIGGFLAAAGGTGVSKNYPTVGRIPNGAMIERELEYGIEDKDSFELLLDSPDFTTALRVASVINRHFGLEIALARDSGTVDMKVPDRFRSNVVGFLAEVEILEVAPDSPARVVLNERTGTIVMGEKVRISTIAVSHGNLTISVTTTNQVSQPGAFSGGETVVVPNRQVEAFEDSARLSVIPATVTLGDLVRGLNAIGVTPRDLIAILQAIKASGAMSADMELM